MPYAGNPALSPDVQQRVLGTFEQTLVLARDGNRQEALLGCDFVLRMDPQFEPARRLQERLRGSTGPVSVDDLTAPAAAADPFAADAGFGLDLPDLPNLGGATAAVPAGGGTDLRSRFQGLLDGRRFQELLILAQKEQEAVGRDPELMRIATAAQERMEAEPYVNKFVGAAREASMLGQQDEVARLLDKVRALDPSHPAIAELSGTGFDFELTLDDEPAPEPAFGMDPELAPATDFLSSGDSESDRRIRELLTEGQRAYDGGDPQGAIDAWSRIFLIDIDHQEASRRIEQARKLKAESERKAEEVFHDGVAGIEAGDLEGAKQAFRRVLEIQPGHLVARDFLQQLEEGKVPAVKSTARDTSSHSALPLPGLEPESTGTDDLKEEILIPPDPSEVAAAERQRPRQKPVATAAPARKVRSRKLFVMVGGAVLVLVLAAGAYVYLNKGKLFPNSTEEPTAPAAGMESGDLMKRALDFQKAGKTPNAIGQLKRIPPGDPSYAKAQELIAHWSGGASASPTPATAAAPAPPVVPPERLALLDSARQAYQAGLFLEAQERFEQAAAQSPLEANDAAMLSGAKGQLEPIVAQVDLFRQHEWEHALRDLWRLHEADPGNRDILRLMVSCYYNLGLRDLQRMDTAKALEDFTEAQNLAPGDAGLKRQIAFTRIYQERPKDLLYRIYVKHLPLR